MTDSSALLAARRAHPLGWIQGLPVPVLLAVYAIVAGLAYSVTGIVLRYTTPAFVATTRGLAAGVLLLALVPVVRARLPATPQQWLCAAALGACNTTLPLLGVVEGTAHAGAAVSSVLLNSSPFVAALLARVALGERLTALRIAGMGLGFAGMLLVVVASSNARSGSGVATGLGFALLGAVGWALAGLGMRRLHKRGTRFDIVGMLAAQFLIGGLLIAPIWLLSSHPAAIQWHAPGLWWGLAYLVLGAQVLVYCIFYSALRRWATARVFAWTFLVPVVSVLGEAARGQLPPRSVIIGIVIVIAGIGTVNLPAAETSTPHLPACQP